MKIKLYSDAHVESAYKIYPEKVSDSKWFDTIWTEQEIYKCKEFELLKDGLDQVFKGLFVSGKDRRDYILEWYKSMGLKGKGLSIACSYGDREYALVSENKDVEVLATDIGPITEKLNELRNELEKNRIQFKKLNALSIPIEEGEFDFILCSSLTYCLTDSELNSFFDRIKGLLKPTGQLFFQRPAL